MYDVTVALCTADILIGFSCLSLPSLWFVWVSVRVRAPNNHSMLGCLFASQSASQPACLNQLTYAALPCQHAISMSRFRGRRCFIASDFVIVVDLLLLYALFFDCLLWIGVSNFIGARAHALSLSLSLPAPLRRIFFANSSRTYFLFHHGYKPRCRYISWEYCNLSERALALDLVI